jgi:transposase
MKVAGIDVGKRQLDVAVHGSEDAMGTPNTQGGVSELIAWLRTREVGRVGLEATGGYERGVRAGLEQAGFEVVVHQPLEVRRFAQLKRWRAKNDRLDARLIAAATAQVEAVKAAQDPRLVELAERLTAYEQVSDQIVRLKTFLESVTLKDLAAKLGAQVRSLQRLKAKLAAEVVGRIKAAADLLARFRLLLSLPGVGPIVAASLVVRMPELGAMRRGQAASLIGVAPFDRDSGQWKGLRFISGGRARPRRMLYLAALQAKRCGPTFKAFADQLLARGKPAKLVIVAVMRKLIEAANLVLQRDQPWSPQPPA